MNKYIFSEEREITSVDIDFNLETKLSSLFLFFQEVSSKQSELLHIGKENTVDKDLHWVITRFAVDINRMPHYEERIKVITYPGESNAIFFYRPFVIEDLKGNILVRASSIWLVVDGKTHMVKKDPFNGLKLPVVHLDNELPLPDKIMGEASLLAYSKTITYSDIDLNSHLNNTRYIELIQDAFPFEFYQDNAFKKITINYLKEFKAHDEVKVYRNEANPYIIIGRKDDNNHFIASLEFKPR